METNERDTDVDELCAPDTDIEELIIRDTDIDELKGLE